MGNKLTRRQFIGYGSAAGLGVYLASRTSFLNSDPAMAAVSPQFALPGSAIPQFVDQVPNLLDANHRIDAGTEQIELQMREQMAQILPAGAVAGYLGTYVWSYLKPGQATRNSYLGPVVIATRGNPTEMKFVNQLGTMADPLLGGTKVDAYRYGTDQTLHWADPLNNEANMWNHMAMPPAPNTEGAYNYGQDPQTGAWTAAPIPACVHLHGGEVPPELDGGPDAWFTSDGAYKGHGFYSKDGAAATYHLLFGFA